MFGAGFVPGIAEGMDGYDSIYADSLFGRAVARVSLSANALSLGVLPNAAPIRRGFGMMADAIPSVSKLLNVAPPQASTRNLVNYIGDASNKLPISNPGSNGFVLVGEGSLETASVVRQGEFTNRVFDSSYGTVDGVSGPLGRSFSPGSGVPTTASETITQRGLQIYNTNDAQQGVIYRATNNIPATSRTSLGGTAPELLIDPSNFGSLDPVLTFPLVP